MISVDGNKICCICEQTVLHPLSSHQSFYNPVYVFFCGYYLNNRYRHAVHNSCIKIQQKSKYVKNVFQVYKVKSF